MKHHYFIALMGAWIITGGLSLFVAAPATAGDCGCEVACGCEPACGCEADCGCEPACGFEEASCGAEQPDCGCEPACGIEPGCGFQPACGLEQSCGCEMGGCDGGCKPKCFNPVYRSLDAVAGGIEKLFGLDKRRHGVCAQCSCEQSTSDCGCGMSGGDVMMGSMMIPTPMPSPPPHQQLHTIPGHAHHGHVPPPVVMPSVRSNSAPLPPSIRTQPRMSAPRLVPSPSSNSAGQHLGRAHSAAPLADPAPNSMPTRQSTIPPVPTPVPDSAPDAFSDPFGDDEVHVRRFQPIKPSSYETATSSLRSPKSSKRRSVSGSTRQRPLSPSYRTSSRRSAAVR